MAAATKELMWLNEKEEEEVGFDWSDRNTNMAAKKESYSVRQLFLHSTTVSTLSLPTHIPVVSHGLEPLEFSFRALWRRAWDLPYIYSLPEIAPETLSFFVRP